MGPAAWQGHVPQDPCKPSGSDGGAKRLEPGGLPRGRSPGLLAREGLHPARRRDIQPGAAWTASVLTPCAASTPAGREAWSDREKPTQRPWLGQLRVGGRRTPPVSTEPAPGWCSAVPRGGPSPEMTCIYPMNTLPCAKCPTADSPRAWGWGSGPPFSPGGVGGVPEFLVTDSTPGCSPCGRCVLPQAPTGSPFQLHAEHRAHRDYLCSPASSGEAHGELGVTGHREPVDGRLCPAHLRLHLCVPWDRHPASIPRLRFLTGAQPRPGPTHKEVTDCAFRPRAPPGRTGCRRPRRAVPGVLTLWRCAVDPSPV